MPYLHLTQETLFLNHLIKLSIQDCCDGIEYSGIARPSDEPVMGLAKFNRMEALTSLDAYLTWKIPNRWSLKEAAAMPFVCTQVRE